MSVLLERCAELPTRDLEEGQVLLEVGRPSSEMYVVVSGSFDVSAHGSVVATITEPGAVVGEISTLLGSEPGATVTATSAATVHVVSNPLRFVREDDEALLEIARILARRLQRLVVYIADVKAQYGDSTGHLGLLDEVLSELTYGQQPVVESGSEREPDSYY